MILIYFTQEYIENILVSEGEVNARVEKISQEIARYYENRPFIILVTLKGAVYFFSKIKENLNKIYLSGIYNNCVIEEYVKASSYHND